ncbi:MAG TPA: DUF3617 domain-containing protein [Sphingomicrobium sp.]|nr:DUF3617 domain-containing protein [Sphingomicrobium sp.]
MNRLLLALPLLLAACDTGPEVKAENASVGEVAEKVRKAGGGAAMTVRPGEWQSDVTLESIEVPGMPPEAATHIKKTMASAVSGHKFCLTPDQVGKPAEDFFAGKDSNCRYETFKMDQGRMAGVMRCDQGGATQKIEFDGSYSPDSYDMRMSTAVEGGKGPGAGMKMAMKIAAKRLGDCQAGSKPTN